MPHISAGKLSQIANIEHALIDTANPATPETGLAKFIKTAMNISDRKARHDLYDQILAGPGLTSEEKACIKILRIFDVDTRTSAQRTKMADDLEHLVVAEDGHGNNVTTADVLEHAGSTPEGLKIFKNLASMLTRENAERLSPLLAIVYPKAAPYLVVYALRNVPYYLYKAAFAQNSDVRSEHLRSVFSSAAEGLRNSGPLIKPTAWLGMKLPIFLQSMGDLFAKDVVKSGVDVLSDKKKFRSLIEFFEAGAREPKKFLKVFDDLGQYFGSKSDTIATFAAVAVHAKFGNKGTLVLQELAHRGFFEAILKGDKTEADKIKKSIPGGEAIVKDLEYIRTHEETPEQKATREAEEAFYNQHVIIPGF